MRSTPKQPRVGISITDGMSGNSPKYGGLLRSLAARHGCSLEYSLPELVSGGLTPPPSRVYPSTVCYMVTVQVGSSSYLGFGPTALISRHAAEFEAYRSVNESLSAHACLPPAVTSPMPYLEAESWVASELDDDLILVDDIQNTDSAVRNRLDEMDSFDVTADSIGNAGSCHKRRLNGEDCSALGGASTPKLCVSNEQAVGGKNSVVATPAICKEVDDTRIVSGCRGPAKHFSSSTTKGVTQNRVQSSSNRVPVGENERFCEIPQNPYSVSQDIDGLMQALANAPTDTEGEGTFRFIGTEKKDITDLAVQAARQRGLNLVFKVSVVGPPYAKQVLVTAICGDMQFEGRHFKKKVARDMASKKLLDALGKREQQQRDGRRPGRSPQDRSPAPSDTSTSGFVSASFPESDSCPVSVQSINNPPSCTAASDHVPGSEQSSSPVANLNSHVMDPPPTSRTSTQLPNVPRAMARREGGLGPAFSLTNIRRSSSSEYESDGAHSVTSLPISTLRQRVTGRGFFHNTIGQLQELMMKEQHCLPVYAEGVESVGKYTEYICIVSAKGLSAKGVGCSKKLARRHAAENMLGVMEEEGMTTNPSLIDNRCRKLLRPSNSRSKLPSHTNPHQQSAFERRETPTPSPPTPSSPRQSTIQPPLHQPNLQAPPLQPNSPRHSTSQDVPLQPNPQSPPLQPNPQVPPAQPNAQDIHVPHPMSRQTLPCQQQRTPPQQSNPQSPLRQQPPLCQLNRQSPPEHSNPQAPPQQSNLQSPPQQSNLQSPPQQSNLQSPPRQSNLQSPSRQSKSNLQSPPRRQISSRQQNPQTTPRQLQPQGQTRQQALPFSPRFPDTHVRPHQRSYHPFLSTHSNKGKFPKSPHSRWQSRPPMQYTPMGPQPHSFSPFGKPHMSYGPPRPACDPQWPPPRPSNSQVPGMQHPIFQGPLLQTPPFPRPPPFPGSPLPHVPPNFKRLNPPESHPGFQGPLQQPQGSPPRPRNGMRFAARATNYQGNPRYPSRQLPSAVSQAYETHSTAGSRQANQAAANTTLSPTICAFSRTRPPITPTDSECESDPEISLQVSPGLFEMLPPDHDSSNLNNSVGVHETATPQSAQDDKIADLPKGNTNENPVRDSAPNSSPTVLPTSTSVASVKNVIADATTWSTKVAVSSESQEPLTVHEIEDSNQTEVAPSHPSHGDVPPLHEDRSGLKELDSVVQEHLPVQRSNGSGTAEEREKTLITQDFYEAKLPPECAHADHAVTSSILTPTDLTPACLKMSTGIRPEGHPVQDVVESSTCRCFATCATDVKMMPSGVTVECVEIGKVARSTRTNARHSPEQNKPVKSTWVPITQEITPYFDQPHSNPLNFSVRLPKERQQWSSTAGVSKEARRPKSTLPPWVGSSPKPCPNRHPQPHLQRPSVQKKLNPQEMQALSNTSQTLELPVHPLLLMTQGQSKTAEGIMSQQQVSNDKFTPSSSPTCVSMLEKFSIVETLRVVDSDVCTLLPTEGSYTRTHLGSILQ